MRGEPFIAVEVRTRGGPRPLPPSRYSFPALDKGSRQGPAAYGGDFAPETIVHAYRQGMFPWPHPDEEFLWFSPDPRAVIEPANFHISRRLARTLRSGKFHATVDGAFDRVIVECADREEGTWITPRIIGAYRLLFELGWAHSVETWTADGELAGGLYGIRVGRMFGAESMFYRVSDGSKAAMVALMEWVAMEGIELVDIQVLTPHTERMGASEIPRAEYLRRLREAVAE